MKIEVDLPESLVHELAENGENSALTPAEYVKELLEQLLVERRLGPQADLLNRPDWQEGLDKSQAELESGKYVSHEEVLKWLKSRGA